MDDVDLKYRYVPPKMKKGVAIIIMFCLATFYSIVVAIWGLFRDKTDTENDSDS